MARSLQIGRKIMDEIKIKGIINKAEFPKIKTLKEKIIKEKGSFPCCGGLEKKYTDAFLQMLWDDEKLREDLARKENLHGKVEWICEFGIRILYL